MTLKKIDMEEQMFIRKLFKLVGKELLPFRIEELERPYTDHCFYCSCRHDFGYKSYCVRGRECESERKRQ